MPLNAEPKMARDQKACPNAGFLRLTTASRRLPLFDLIAVSGEPDAEPITTNALEGARNDHGSRKIELEPETSCNGTLEKLGLRCEA
jgi:hypothetical protein